MNCSSGSFCKFGLVVESGDGGSKLTICCEIPVRYVGRMAFNASTHRSIWSCKIRKKKQWNFYHLLIATSFSQKYCKIIWNKIKMLQVSKRIKIYLQTKKLQGVGINVIIKVNLFFRLESNLLFFFKFMEIKRKVVTQFFRRQE